MDVSKERYEQLRTEFIDKFVAGVKGELETHLDFTGDKLKDTVDALRHTRHMGYTICGSLTKSALREGGY